jgi:hypothetical protein
MLNRQEIKLVMVVAGMFVFSGTTIGLELRSLSPEVSKADAFLLLFWDSLFCERQVRANEEGGKHD